MPKFMNNPYGYSRIFMDADKGGGAGGATGKDDAGDGGDQDDEESDEDGEGDDEPKFTKADLDKAIARTIAKERKKAERAAQKKDKPEEEKPAETEDAKARKAAEAKASKLEVRIACFEADVAKDAVDDVAALARAYMDADEDLDLEDAIEKVVKKYPQFKKGAADPYEDEEKKSGSWGQRQNGKGASKLSGVEARFYELNPDLKK